MNSPKDDDGKLEPMHDENRRKTVLDRIHNFFGHLIGSEGKRHGARDTDPGQ